MQATRWEILEILKEAGEATIDDLARQLGLAPITVRYHLNILEHRDLIAVESVRRHVGRPHYVYSLTDEAEELFPKKYHILADRLLAEVKNSLGESQITELFHRMATDISAEHLPKLSGKSTEERLKILVELLAEEGFLSRWERRDDGFTLVETGCPYCYVAPRHPEVCNMDLQLITEVMEVPVTRSTCMAHGDDVCTFHISGETSNP